MKRSIYIIISLLFFNTCFSQDYNNLYQKWYLTESYDCLNDSIIKESKWNLNIKSNKNLIIFFNNEKLNKEVSYSLSDSILIFNKINFQIKKLTKDSLAIISDYDKCKKYFFLSENSLYNLQKDNFFLNKGDTIYYATEYFAPKLKNQTSYFSYFIKSAPYMTTKENCVFQIRLIINKKGEVGDYIGDISCIKNPEKKIKKLIDETRGKWEPMYLNNQPVNALIRVKFKQGKSIIIQGY